jgi:hypothetical protein
MPTPLKAVAFGVEHFETDIELRTGFHWTTVAPRAWSEVRAIIGQTKKRETDVERC